MSSYASWTLAPAPFDCKSGTAAARVDTVLHTSDNVRFYVHQVVLAVASPIFADMFTNLRHPPAQDGPTSGGLFVLNIDEDSFVINHMLRYCYPVAPAILSTLDAVDRILGAAKKYGMEEAVRLIQLSLRTFVDKEPLKALAISCRHACREEAVLAAQAWKKTRCDWTFLADDFRDTAGALCYSPVLGSLPATVHYRLAKYVVTGMLPEYAFYEPLSAPFLKRSADLDTYPFNQPATDVVLLSTDGVAFPVHRNILELHVAANPQYPPRSSLLTPLDEGSSIQTSETSPVLSQLLRLCYPANLEDHMSQITDANCCSRQMVAAVSAASDYDMHSIVDNYKRHLRHMIPQDPFAVYVIALRFNWATEAHDAAIFMARHVVLPRIRSEWMDVMSTKQYYGLLQFWCRCQGAILAAIQEFVPDTEMAGPQWKRDWYRGLSRNGQRVRAVLTPLVEREVKKTSIGKCADLGLDFAALCEESQELEYKIAERLNAVCFRLAPCFGTLRS